MLRALWMLISLMRALPLLALTLTAPAFASDGVLEINQTCAVSTEGCFPGDDAGWPVLITQPGSYRLTSNLSVPNQNTRAIGILPNVSEVSIDLSGFAIRGPVTCAGTPLTCSPASGQGSGIEGAGGNHNISVKNGSITGLGYCGVFFLDGHVEVENLRVRWNASCGIFVGDGSIIRANSVSQNGFQGITTAGSTVLDNASYKNGSTGISANIGSTVSGNNTYQNAGAGIFVGEGSIASGNTAFQNGLNGISAGFGSTVSANTAYDNGNDGIFANTGSTVWGNTVRSNTGFGLNLGSQSGYRENVISNNTAGTVNGPTAVNLGNNACNGSTTCP